MTIYLFEKKVLVVLWKKKKKKKKKVGEKFRSLLLCSFSLFLLLPTLINMNQIGGAKEKKTRA